MSTDTWVRDPFAPGPFAPGPFAPGPVPPAAADPIPGDPAAVAGLARTMAATASAASRAAAALARHAGAPSWQGAAADAFAGVVVELPPLLERVAARYAAAARALHAYGTELAVARSRAQAARTLAHGPSPDLAAAHRALAEAVAIRERAAGAAAAQLTAIAHDGLRDHRSLAGLLGRLTHPAADFTVHTVHLDQISALLGVAALGAACVLPPAAAAIETVALVTGGVALAAQAELARTGDGSWGEVGATAAGVALFGAGRIYGATTRAAADLREAERAVLAAGTDARLRADASAAVLAARAGLPRHPLVPQRAHLAELAPQRIGRRARDDWAARGGPRPPALDRARETTEALRGRLGVAVAANTAVKVGVEAESRRRTACDAVPD